jgi:hypothetical protein
VALLLRGGQYVMGSDDANLHGGQRHLRDRIYTSDCRHMYNNMTTLRRLGDGFLIHHIRPDAFQIGMVFEWGVVQSVAMAVIQDDDLIVINQAARQR